MQGYVPGQDTAFAQARDCYQELEDWLASEETAGLQHADLEEQLDVRGRGLMRRLLQDRLGLTAPREEPPPDVAGADGGVPTRAARGRTRPLTARIRQVPGSRAAPRPPGKPHAPPP